MLSVYYKSLLTSNYLNKLSCSTISRQSPSARSLFSPVHAVTRIVFSKTLANSYFCRRCKFLCSRR